ncbi:MAG: SEL1-like repeat protein [Hydrogenimonas sp.]|nr:SEL1-like repeat protein [Hydrogenimonas sp.]
MYDKGLGVEKDHEKALKWCKKAAHAGHKKAKSIIRRLQEEGKIAF